MPFDRPWKGQITTNWDTGGPRNFRLHPSNIVNTTATTGTFKGDGSTYNGRAFDIKHGKYTIHSDWTLHFSFDMKFISGEPTERFHGHMNVAETRIKGSVKLKDPSRYDNSLSNGAYAGYHCSVTLH